MLSSTKALSGRGTDNALLSVSRLGELGKGTQSTLYVPPSQSEGRAHGNLTYFPFILSISFYDGEEVPSPSLSACK